MVDEACMSRPSCPIGSELASGKLYYHTHKGNDTCTSFSETVVVVEISDPSPMLFIELCCFETAGEVRVTYFCSHGSFPGERSKTENHR